MVPVARLFIAVLPSEALAQRLRELERADPRVRWVRPDRWHVTLRFLGDGDPAEVSALMGEAELPAAVAGYGPTVDILGDRVVVVPVSGLDELAGVTARSLRSLDTHDDRRPFHGHLTLGRLRRPGVRPPMLGRAISFVEPVDGVALVDSSPDGGGTRYTILETWPVGRASPQ